MLFPGSRTKALPSPVSLSRTPRSRSRLSNCSQRSKDVLRSSVRSFHARPLYLTRSPVQTLSSVLFVFTRTPVSETHATLAADVLHRLFICTMNHSLLAHCRLLVSTLWRTSEEVATDRFQWALKNACLKSPWPVSTTEGGAAILARSVTCSLNIPTARGADEAQVSLSLPESRPSDDVSLLKLEVPAWGLPLTRAPPF